MSLTSWLFRLARFSADVEAVRKGRASTRLKNKLVGRVAARVGIWRRLWGKW